MFVPQLVPTDVKTIMHALRWTHQKQQDEINSMPVRVGTTGSNQQYACPCRNNRIKSTVCLSVSEQHDQINSISVRVGTIGSNQQYACPCRNNRSKSTVCLSVSEQQDQINSTPARLGQLYRDKSSYSRSKIPIIYVPASHYLQNPDYFVTLSYNL